MSVTIFICCCTSVFFCVSYTFDFENNNNSINDQQNIQPNENLLDYHDSLDDRKK